MTANNSIPQHIAIIMDGNGRWAKKRFMPRIMGHKRGLDVLDTITRVCSDEGVRYLTVFAFSTENWRRPDEEVSFLMGLFIQALQKRVARMHKNNLRLLVIGRRDRFAPEIIQAVEEAEALTAHNSGMTLTIAADYGGRQDIIEAVVKAQASGLAKITEESLQPFLALAHAPEPDLFIRTGGETRISNFMLWQLAYTELYFTDTLWPDFDEGCLKAAMASFNERERRFGQTSEQLPSHQQRE